MELLRSRYDLKSRVETESFLDRIRSVLTPIRIRSARSTIFYNEGIISGKTPNIELRRSRIKVEEELKASIKGRLQIAELGAGAATKLSDEEKIEVVQRGKLVINAIQMRELTDVLRFLNEDVFPDEHDQFYICIDRLDENWIDEGFRYLLIRSLIETIRDFLQVRNIKIVAALRTDLIERVFRFTRDPGFQEGEVSELVPVRSVGLKINC